MSSHPVFPEPTGAPGCGAAQFLIALAPDHGLAQPPDPPDRCRWLVHDGIAALCRAGAPGAAASWPRQLWRVPGITRLDPQPVFADLAELDHLLRDQAVTLRCMLAEREPCAEYRVFVTGYARPADMRGLARLAQDLADLSQALRAVPAPLRPRASPLMAVSLMVHVDRIERLLAVLDEASNMAEAMGVTLDVVGPDALRSFPVSLAVGQTLFLTRP